MKKNLLCFFLILLISGMTSTPVYSTIHFWKDINNDYAPLRSAASSWATEYRFLQLNISAMKNFLDEAPKENFELLRSGSYIFELPQPDGGTASFRIMQSPVMEKPLADAYPLINTYAGQCISDPAATIRFDVTPYGFHAMVISPNGTWFIDPVDMTTDEWYVSYYKKNAIPHGSMYCLMSDEPNYLAKNSNRATASFRTIQGSLRTYRLALACTGEYSALFSASVSGTLAGMVTSINRVNGVYEREFGIHMNLVANDTLLIFTNSTTDPYTNSNGSAMLSQNQTTCDNIIGSSNYDIGHVFSTGGGGIAFLGCVCNNSNKARGVTGSPSPFGDPFDIDYVAHEMGHQFGGNHTFNSTAGACSGNRVNSAAFEPGSGSTIMAYAGICGSQNLQPHSDDYFHTHSFDEIIDYTQLSVGNVCPVKTFPANLAPILTVPPNYTIPLSTPFRLTASAIDPNGDPVTYCWEQYDLGPAGNWNAPLLNAPIFRSFDPVATGTRLFPKLANILNNTTTIGEIKPSYARSLKFRCTARDNILNGAGVTYNDIPVQITVANTPGPFEVTSPNTAGIVWTAGSTQTITWSVNGSDAPPVSAPNVNVLLSLDGGQNFTMTLGNNVPNNGAWSIAVPSVSTNTARVMVEGAGNIFFDINNFNFTINPLAVNENVFSSSISAYPNPLFEVLNISMINTERGEIQLILFDSAGRKIFEKYQSKTKDLMEATLDCSTLVPGIYFLQTVSKSYSALKRIVKM